METIRNLYKSFFGMEPASISPLTPAASSRHYYRVTGPRGVVVATKGDDPEENRTFARLSKKFRRAGASVPEVYGLSEDGRVYLQQDLGDTSLFSLLHSPGSEELIKQSLAGMIKLQLAGGIEDEELYPVVKMNSRHVIADLHYFKYCFLRAAGIEPADDQLEKDFEALARMVEQTPESLSGLMLRDCQSRNVMIHEEEPWFIDFQSARRGPLLYDLASFLWQARAGFSASLRRQMTEFYMHELAKFRSFTREEFYHSLSLMLWIRTMQVLGAYGLRGLGQHKSMFLQVIPKALENVKQLLDSSDFEELTALRRALRQLLDLPRFAKPDIDPSRLNVTVFSFSYKQGYPEDMSGNGGGFMFDCRAMHNPGRYDQYKQLTGLDKPVIDFLEERGEVQQFVKTAAALVEPAVRRYTERGFSSLQVGFGCTGGRHRSVYCAEVLAKQLRGVFNTENVRIKIIHREQNISKEL